MKAEGGVVWDGPGALVRFDGTLAHNLRKAFICSMSKWARPILVEKKTKNNPRRERRLRED